MTPDFSWVRAPKLSLYPKEHESQGRAYKNPVNGESYPSVTSILRYEDKSNLIQWAVDRAVWWCIDNWQDLGVDPDQAFMKARYRHNDVRDERAWVGTGVHAFIEAEHTDSWDVPELNEEQSQIVEWWKVFNKTHTIEPILSEFTIFNTVDGYAGTADGLWSITDNLTGDNWVALVDIKTSKRIWDGHFMQLAALASGEYRLAETSNKEDFAQKWKNPESGKVETSYWAVHDMPKFDKIQILHLTVEGAELVDVSNIDLHYKKFLAYKSIFDADQELKLRKKEDNNV